MMKNNIFKNVSICKPQRKLNLNLGNNSLSLLACVAPSELPFDEAELVEIQKFMTTEFEHSNPYHVFLIEFLLIYDKKYLDDLIKPDQ